MKSIVYIVLYFGKFPSIFPLWLNSCRNNPTIDWLIFTDDHSCFNYPQNVRVEYTTFENIQARFKKHFDYPVVFINLINCVIIEFVMVLYFKIS